MSYGNIFDGTITFNLEAAVVTMNIEGGTVIYDASGTITTANIVGGILDYTNATDPRALTTLNYGGDGAEIRYDPNLITVGTVVIAADFPITINAGKT